MTFLLFSILVIILLIIIETEKNLLSLLFIYFFLIQKSGQRTTLKGCGLVSKWKYFVLTYHTWSLHFCNVVFDNWDRVR